MPLTRAITGSGTTAASGGGTPIFGEEPTPAGDVVTTAGKFIDGTERVYLNGVRQGSDCYTTSESVPTLGYDTITFTFSLHSSDDVMLDYAAA